MIREKWQPPLGDEPAGVLRWKRSTSPYEQFMDEEGLPVHRGIGVYDVRDLELGTWRRLGARGCFLYLDGIEDSKGLYVVEVPAGRALNLEKHMYDEFFLVLEGRGTTEVSSHQGGEPYVFEWQPGSLFVVPLNAPHRLVNATATPALLLSANNAPVIMNVFQSRRFIFENAFEFSERLPNSETFFAPVSEIEPDDVRGRAAVASNVFPDIVNCELPLDNQRAPGYRRIQPYYHGYMRDEEVGGFIAEYPVGRYSKAHYHPSGAVLVCLSGQGYTYTWPIDAGQRPWETGQAHLVREQKYKAGGLVAAAPGGGNWFHQHFAVSNVPFRVMNFWGGPLGRWGGERNKREITSWNLGIAAGGRAIEYWDEDPHIRAEFQRRLEASGVTAKMPATLYNREDAPSGPEA